MPSRVAATIALIVAGVLSSTCGKGPTDPSDNTIETFTGTVSPGLGNLGQHPFHVSNNGELFITLVSLTPPLPPGKYAILSLGVATGTGCGYDGTVQNNFALPGTLLSPPAREGDYCVAIIDKGDFTTAETYEIRVSHP